MTRLQRKRICLPMMIAAAALCSIAFVMADGPNLVICDEPDPFGKIVFVPLVNLADGPSAGVLTVRVMMGEKEAVVRREVTVAARGQMVQSVLFPARVTEIIHAGIIEGPDPIPQ